jgi:hypothetical protein
MKYLGWIVPTHPPRREQLLVLVETFEKYASDVDLIVVWSRKSEDFLVLRPNIKCIYLDDFFSDADIELFEKTRSIINIKKLFGVMHEYPSYKGLICTDDEIEFIRFFKGEDLLSHFLSRKVFPATDISNVKSKDNIIQRILVESCKFLPSPHDRLLIKDATKSYSLFSWFSDLPFYDCKDVPGFLGKFNLTDYESLKQLSFYTFDHILYQYYKLLSSEYKYQTLDWKYDFKGAYNWFECLHLEPINYDYVSYYHKNFTPKWTSSATLSNQFTDAICLFHTDRVNLRYSKFLMTKHHLKSLVMTIFPKLRIVE